MINLSKKVSILSLVTASALLTPINNAQAQNEISREEIRNEEIKKITNTTPKQSLTADRVKPTATETNLLDSLLLRMSSEKEDKMFPANDIYDDWNTEIVKAYAGYDIPDFYTIDVSSFVMPVGKEQTSQVTSSYGPRRKRFHYGTDIKLQVGDTVYAAFDGKIRVKQYERRGYGYFLVLRHPNGLETVYGHLSEFLVDQDQYVIAGQPIALGGNTGRSTGPHLHFEFRFLGRSINPAEIIDFNLFCLKEDKYTYIKGKSEQAYFTYGNKYAKRKASKTSSTNKYATKGKSKIKYYRVKEGDSLQAISKKSGVSVEKIRKLNKIRSTNLQKGKAIRIS
jgi:murein DD-endopeptidase MepM/ murein hydrolase activator NlpD